MDLPVFARTCLLLFLWTISLLGRAQDRPVASACAIPSSDTAAVSCCAGEGRCTGSAYCSACTNCSRCQHCKGGGTCGVCAGGGSRSARSYSSGSRFKSRADGSSSPSGGTFGAPATGTVADDPSSAYYLRTLEVTSPTLNVRAGPGTTYPVLYQLQQRDAVTYLARAGEWIKVRVDVNGVVGYVHYKYVHLGE